MLLFVVRFFIVFQKQMRKRQQFFVNQHKEEGLFKMVDTKLKTGKTES